MKVSAEIFLENIDQYNFDQAVFFVTGNEIGLVNKIENSIIKNKKFNNFNEIKILDFKNNNKINLEDLTNTQSLFSDSNILQIKNPNDSLIENLEKLNLKNNTVVVSGENIKSGAKLKKYFDNHKYYYSVLCYKMTKSFKKKLLDKLFNENNCKLSKDAYSYFLESSSDEFQTLESEALKISNYNVVNISLEDIKRLSSSTNLTQYEDLFFQCIKGDKKLIIRDSCEMIKTSEDAYKFIQLAKNFFRILTYSSEEKNGNNIGNLVERYLPKYLFRQKNNFQLAIAKTDLNKMVMINKLLQKTELYLRKNDSNFLIGIQRFLLNFSIILK